MMEINSYPKIYGLGHRAIRDIFREPVLIQEKVDGSQISFMREDDNLYARSKGAKLDLDYPQKMFKRGVEEIKDRFDGLLNGAIYRGEYLEKPKHNVLEYDRIPKGHIILFDIQVGLETYMEPEEVFMEAMKLGFEAVPFWKQVVKEPSDLTAYLLNTSILGGAAVEGVVFKNYKRFDEATGKVLMGKYVSEAFKEVHRKTSYKTSNKDIITSLTEHYKTEARWWKAVQHLKERDELLGDPRDIGRLIKEVNIDILEECREEIEEALFKWGWKQISRGVTAGLPEWYKEQLLELQFKHEKGEDFDD